MSNAKAERGPTRAQWRGVWGAPTPPVKAPGKRTLILFVKQPRAGRVKTRLGQAIGMPVAAWWFRHQCARLIREVDAPRRWKTVLAVSPDTACTDRSSWPAHLPRLPQGSGDLGARMIRALEAAPPGPALVIGADIPGITKGHIERAFRTLGRADAVFGPAPDGGYWLIGLARRRGTPLRTLRDVRWSSPHALADSAQSLAPLRISMIDVLADIDTEADLISHQRRVLH